MSAREWFCGLCGEALDDTAIRVFEDDPGSGYCYRCAERIATAFNAARGREIAVPDMRDHRDLIERVDALEDLTRRVKNVWVLWLNDATKGAINPGTFHTMKTMLGIEEA